MNKTEIIIIDLETTGLTTKNNHIVEIGVVKLNLKTGVINVIYNHVISLPKPEDIIEYENSWIFQNTGLTPVEVYNGVPIEHAIEKIQPYLNNYFVTAFNNKFDFKFLEADGFIIPNKAADIMLSCMNTVNVRFPNGRIKYPNAQAAHDYFFPNVGYSEAHRALDDAWHEAMIVKALYDLKLFKI